MTTQVGRKVFHRLPTCVVPENYKLKISTDFPTFSFKGKEEIDVVVKEQTDTIILNSLNLKVSDVFFCHDQSCVSALTVIESNEDEMVTFKFPYTLPLGHSVLKLKFEGFLTDNMKGFYRSKYIDSTGKEHFGASTQFEPTDARRAFPCWDEPAVKATYDIILVAPKGKVVLSNMNVIEKLEEETIITYRFARTPIMSSYLVAYVIGDFDCVTREIEGGLKISVYAQVEKAYMGEFALEAACKTVPFYTKYFGVPYPLSKLDLIAIPDFAFGAMENWGLITYREMALLVDEKSSAQSFRYVALVVGHEIAHQWFGNLVTMEWWTHLWLNEGFASWIEYLSVAYCFPSYEIWRSFATSDFARAMELDGLRNSHPIEVQVGHPSEITEIFDAISYSKGASIIRMLFDYIGEEAFAGGLSMYLKHFSYRNTQTEDLWYFLSKFSGKEVGKIMSTWTSQMGYPILTVAQRNSEGCIDLSFTQERFISDGSKSDDKVKWIIPMSVTTSEDPDNPVRFLFEKESDSIKILVPSTPKWVKLNYGNVGFYRVKYPDDMFAPLVSALFSFTVEERLGFLSDTFALAKSGSLPTTKYLELLVNLATETDNNVWEEVSTSTMSIMNLLYYSQDSNNNTDKLKKVLLNLLKPVYEYVGIDKASSKAKEETHDVLLLRAIITGLFAKLRSPEIVRELRSLCEKHISGQIIAAPDIRSSLFYAMLCSNNEADFDKLIEYYEKSNETEEKIRILRSLGALTEPGLVNKALLFSISKSVRSQDCFIVFMALGSNPKSRPLAWEFLKSQWSFIYKRYEGGHLVYRILNSVVSGFVDLNVYTDIKKFFEFNSCGVSSRSLQQSLENIVNNHGWLKRDEESIKDWLSMR